ncbi:MAG: hypothetical protein Q4G69_13910 [Planctomycetia bacterium]|nr:hypothetical protein [Planctomycetia bacterium]
MKSEETPDPEKQKILDEIELDEEMRTGQRMVEDRSRSPWRTLTTGLIVGGIPAIWAISKNGSGEGFGIGILVLLGVAIVCGIIVCLASKSVNSNEND